jgi:hypothetical protein
VASVRERCAAGGLQWWDDARITPLFAIYGNLICITRPSMLAFMDQAAGRRGKR